MKKDEFPYYVSYEEIPDHLVQLARHINRYLDKRPDKHFKKIMYLVRIKFPKEKFQYEMLNNAHYGLYEVNFMNYLHHNLSHMNYWQLSECIHKMYF